MRRPLRSAALALEALAVGWVLACGQIEIPPVEGTGGAAVGAGGAGTGGTTAPSGGQVGLGTGGATPGSSGGGPSPDAGGAELDSCGVPLGIFDPPCSTEDRFFQPGCSAAPEVAFEYSTAELEVPTSSALRLVLLPTDFDGGFGGEGSTSTPPHALHVTIDPTTAGTVTEAGFSLTEAGATLRVVLPNAANLPAYFTEIANPESNYSPYREGRLALMDGSTILHEQRLLLDPFLACLVK